MAHLTQFSHTGVFEVYQSLFNRWAPKSTHFSYKGMVARSQLAAIDFSQNLEQAKTKGGVNRANVCFSKMTKTWAVKPIKEAKCLVFFSVLMKERFDCIHKNIPKNIVPIPKPAKIDAIANH